MSTEQNGAHTPPVPARRPGPETAEVPVVSFGRHTLNQIEIGITREWVEANGLGAYAMGTAVGVNTRRHHGLYLASADSFPARKLLVNRVEESAIVRNRKFDFSCQEYPGAISPQGHLFLESFSYDPFPAWIYSVEDLKIKKTFFLRQGEDTAVLRYRHLVGPPIRLIVKPFLSCRNHHSLIREDYRFRGAVAIEGREARVSVADAPAFHMTAAALPDRPDAVRIQPEEYWYKNLVYAQEEEMGLNYLEDLYVPCLILAELAPDQELDIIFSREKIAHLDVERWAEQELFLRKAALENCNVRGPFARRCALAADQMVVRSGDRTRLVAGYPWQGLEMRETLMSLPGLLCATGRLDESREILRDAARLLNRGLLPKSFEQTDPAAAQYDGIDTALWFVWAVQEHWKASEDLAFLKEMKDPIEGIVRAYSQGISVPNQGSQCEIRMDADGLIFGSSENFPMTWMNGSLGGWMSTRRNGKPVEVQALWYNALQFCSEALLKIASADRGWGELAKRSRDNFNTLFWNSQNNYLYDFIDGNFREGSIRPNALYAISLPYEILEPDRFQPLMETAWKALYTSFGLRTLSPSEPHFRGLYNGDEKSRVSALHNGTVHPFLIGPFLTAFFKTFGRGQSNKQKAAYFLSPFVAHLSDAGLGTVSELFDGSPPHHPRGAVADARAVAEILRVMKEEGLEI